MRKIEYIHTSVLHPHPDNPRKELGDLTELAASIKAKGVLQNLTVVPDTKDGGYRIIIGHRRHAASKLAGLTDLPCVIADMTPQEQFETMMVENVQRSDLTVYEQAEGFQMMLDMGGSVEEVAQKTGFSETTVRNRISLLRLDKKKFDKAEERGANLTDYLKLNAIKDPERRNKVLDFIGTGDFNYHLKQALEDQKFAEKFTVALKTIQEADWCRARTDENIAYNGPWKSYRYFDKHNQEPIVPPKDADTVEYIYSIENNIRIYIYRRTPEDKKRSPIEDKQDRYKSQAEQIDKQLRQIAKIHRELREEFIQNFSAFNNNQFDIEAFAAKALLNYAYGGGDVELLGKLTGIAFDLKKHPRESEMWNKMLFNHPIRALLCATYARLEKVGCSYCTTQWHDNMKCSVPRHEKCESLDLLYEGLCSIGYEMSEDEKQLQDGSHPLFKEAKDLIAAFKKEKV
jgi:ParB family chromosome partitioning protein